MPLGKKDTRNYNLQIYNLQFTNLQTYKFTNMATWNNQAFEESQKRTQEGLRKKREKERREEEIPSIFFGSVSIKKKEEKRRSYFEETEKPENSYYNKYPSLENEKVPRSCFCWIFGK